MTLEFPGHAMPSVNAARKPAPAVSAAVRLTTAARAVEIRRVDKSITRSSLAANFGERAGVEHPW